MGYVISALMLLSQLTSSSITEVPKYFPFHPALFVTFIFTSSSFSQLTQQLMSELAVVHDIRQCARLPCL